MDHIAGTQRSSFIDRSVAFAPQCVDPSAHREHPDPAGSGELPLLSSQKGTGKTAVESGIPPDSIPTPIGGIKERSAEKYVPPSGEVALQNEIDSGVPASPASDKRFVHQPVQLQVDQGERSAGDDRHPR